MTTPAITVSTAPLGYGDLAVWRTVRHMVGIILGAFRDPVVRDAARHVLQYCVPYDVKCELQSVFSFVQRQVRYTRDPAEQEYLQTPQFLLSQMGPNLDQRAIGDCDDMIMLLLSMLKSIGYPVALKVTGYGRGGGDPLMGPDFSHVYGAVLAKKIWIIVDPIRPDFVVGREGPPPSKVGWVEVGTDIPLWLVALSDGVV